MPSRVTPGLEVVGDGDEIEPELLGVDGEVEELLRAELLGGSLVAERQLRHLARSSGVSTSKARPGQSRTWASAPAVHAARSCTAAEPRLAEVRRHPARRPHRYGVRAAVSGPRDRKAALGCRHDERLHLLARQAAAGRRRRSPPPAPATSLRHPCGERLVPRQAAVVEARHAVELATARRRRRLSGPPPLP